MSLKDASRRRFMKGALTGIPAVTIGSGVSLTAFADEPPQQLTDYQPAFFEAAEWDFIIAACDRLIPGQGPGPGALDTNVPIFIDRQMEGGFGHAADWYMKGPFPDDVPALFGHQIPLTPREMYREGIAAVNDFCQDRHDAAFAALDDAARDQVLTQLQDGEIEMASMRGSYFFDMLLQNTKEGYFADPIHGGNKHMASWKFIGFPGARASYREWVDQHNVEYPLGPVSLNGERG
ncbi:MULTISPECIES: gluconate 2-dehydrogenase subunit 3 family protein [unclassified Halomonas]|uniref:gluconate 2-dehydrogenase subunit 3 family protein n=1 Tax=unclassified Halomonas TaxID=2609666 RepID=UPI0021E43CF5|nr:MULTISPECIES: gluconate 2-dehydrogenase subunit 3 family protein [unclassified Halomonas]UYF99817.1 gluconate 2-dehydrogenase subunit 3 family protein [Halomonas sp. GD1P12]WNL39090.1 gluconate 2-dehydrogenase subunit 3 family protein [Halomonas sp. PAMB 3232]